MEPIRGEAGWSTFEERIGKAVLSYKIRLKKMDENRWARKVYEWLGQGSKWERSSKRWERKCGLQGFTDRIHQCSEGELKRKVNIQIQEQGREVWRQRMEGKSSLIWYKEKTTPKCEAFYDGSLGSSLLFKARTKSLEVNGRTYRWANEGSKICQKCVGGIDETVEHFMLLCLRYEEERDHLLGVVAQEVSVDQWDRVGSGNIDEIMKFLLGLSRVEETNKKIIEGVKIYLERAWHIRAEN